VPIEKRMAKSDDEPKEIFWADQLARKIVTRKQFRYTEKKTPKFSEYVVKTSASISGVLHIGRLSDTIRGASVYRALADAGEKARLVWVAEDMDPLRKIPAGVPADYEKYIGTPVSIIPDPDGCHTSYADHHTDSYFQVLHQFTFEDMDKFSMQAEYKKGTFAPSIKKILASLEVVKEIQNKHRTNPLKKEWSPWTPVCGNCGKIVTPRVKFLEDGKVSYVCKDYLFETKAAVGCGHKGEANPLKDAGKLAWKSEWAAQWAAWKIATEGAGKEYQVPNSAFWINAEIVERVLEFPAPEPLFYEHIMIDGTKMSASLGNVVYPKDWLTVAPPELLRYFYNKRLMMTRSFSWKELPMLYDDYDRAAAVYAGKSSMENEKEDAHLKRMYELSNKKGSQDAPLELSFAHATMIAQTFSDDKKIVANLKKADKYNAAAEEGLLERVHMAREWIRLYAPEDYKFSLQASVGADVKKQLSAAQRKAVKAFAELIASKQWKEKELFDECYALIKKEGLKPQEFFSACYLVLLGKERGPRLVPFVLTLGEKAIALFEQV
jgi:lysyl-tRNA synthetase, class I